MASCERAGDVAQEMVPRVPLRHCITRALATNILPVLRLWAAGVVAGRDTMERGRKGRLEKSPLTHRPVSEF